MSGEISVRTAMAKWASIGLHVFPYVATAKMPFAGTHGHLDATDDPAAAVALYDRLAIRQAAGVGVHTGPSGILTIDPDNAEAEAMLRRHVGGAALETLWYLTRRARQYVYRAPEGVILPNGQENIAGISGLDSRSGSSFAAFPPSPVKTLDAHYRFPDHDLADVMAHFWDLILPAPESVLDLMGVGGAGEPAPRRVAPPRGADGRTWLAEGTRNAEIHAACAAAHRSGADEEGVTALAETMNKTQCREPLPANEIAGVVKSVMRNVNMGFVITEEKVVSATKLDEEAPRPELAPKLHRLDVAYMVENDPPPVDWVLDGIAARSAVTMLHGDAGLGKSMFALAGAVAVTRGAPFMNHSTPRGRVLYIDAENGKGEAHRRIRALGLTAAEAGSLVYCEALGVDLRSDADELLSAAVDAEPDLVIADSLATLSRSDEDSSGETTLAIQVLQRIARETGAAVILLHHDKKDKTNFRGSSAIAAVVEIRWHLTKDADRENARRLVNEKCRLAAEGPERWVEIRQSECGIEVVQISKPPTSKEAEAWDSVVELLSDGRSRTNREIAVETGLASPGGGCPGSLARLLKEKREAGYLVGGSAGGVTLAPHLLPTKNVEDPAKAPPPAAPRPDPLIPPPRDGSRDQSTAGAFMPDPDIGEAA